MNESNETNPTITAYIKLLFHQNAIWKADAQNIIMRKKGTRKQTIFLFKGAVHVNLKESSCTCKESKFGNCLHIDVCSRIELNSLPTASGVISKIPYLCVVKKGGWGLVTKDAGVLNCITCKSKGQRECEHVKVRAI